MSLLREFSREICHHEELNSFAYNTILILKQMKRKVNQKTATMSLTDCIVESQGEDSDEVIGEDKRSKHMAALCNPDD